MATLFSYIQYMNCKVVESQIDKYTPEGDITGDWVAQSKYKYSWGIDDNDSTKPAFRVNAILLMDFSNGGSKEYLCHVMFFLIDVVGRPDRDFLIKCGLKAPTVLDKSFQQKKLIEENSSVWADIDRDHLEKSVDKILSEHYPL